MPDFSQIWINTSSTTFTLESWGCSTDTVLGTVNISPGNTLEAGAGVEKLEWSQALSTIASGYTDGEMVWKDKNGTKIGIQIHVPIQVFFMGTAPYYRVKLNNGDWEGERHSEEYTFDTAKTPSYKVTVRPTAEHSTFALKVEITDTGS